MNFCNLFLLSPGAGPERGLGILTSTSLARIDLIAGDRRQARLAEVKKPPEANRAPITTGKKVALSFCAKLPISKNTDTDFWLLLKTIPKL